jgi:trehalose 2-sulfotransferase
MPAYLICATPRTGSSLLCGLLDSTGVAGHPESWFRAPDEPDWAARWGVDASRYGDFVRAAITAGSTPNGVFAARIMWGTLDQVVARLGGVYPELAGRDTDLLDRAFGRIRYVYLRRGDVVAQAVSLARAEQTGVWFETEEIRPRPAGEPRYDFGLIDEQARLIEEHNRAWRDWFASAGIQPHVVRYEDLEVEPAEVARGVLGFLGLPADGEIAVRHRRLADELNAEWITRYRAVTHR